LRAQLLQIAREVDPHPWKDRLRDPRVWHDRQQLEALAAEVLALLNRPAEPLAPVLLTVLAFLLVDQQGDAVPLLRAAQRRHPTDFWLSFDLGTQLSKQGSAEASEGVGFLRAALVLRPESVAVYNNLGLALQAKGQVDEAIAAWRDALRCDPK